VARRGVKIVTRAARPSRAAIVSQLKLAARKGDRAALTLAIEQMKTWAYSPRYWLRYLQLLAHPLARLVDLTVIKQGEKIARQKGWVTPTRRPPAPRTRRRPPVPPPARPARARVPTQPSLFPDLPV
jgi:phosphoribosyl-dephospho-CoA transferase